MDFFKKLWSRIKKKRGLSLNLKTGLPAKKVTKNVLEPPFPLPMREFLVFKFFCLNTSGMT